MTLSHVNLAFLAQTRISSQTVMTKEWNEEIHHEKILHWILPTTAMSYSISFTILILFLRVGEVFEGQKFNIPTANPKI
jgi:hypothetical protein